MYEYNDTKDDANLEKIPNDPAFWKFHELDNLKWNPSYKISDNGSHIFYLNVTSEQSVVPQNHSDPFEFHSSDFQ